jgi:hypothetical protein
MTGTTTTQSFHSRENDTWPKSQTIADETIAIRSAPELSDSDWINLTIWFLFGKSVISCANPN